MKAQNLKKVINLYFWILPIISCLVTTSSLSAANSKEAPPRSITKENKKELNPLNQLEVNKDNSVKITKRGDIVLAPQAPNGEVIVTSKTNTPSFRFVPENGHQQSILHLAPAIPEGGSNISFWSSPNGTSKRLRPLNIKTHGVNDYYDKQNNHVSFYTTDKDGKQPKAFQWNWGDLYDARLQLPTMGLELFRIYNIATGSVTSPFGLYIHDPTLSTQKIATNYAIYIESQTAGLEDNYSIFSEGAKNYFGGQVGIGMKQPKHALDVNGDINFSGQLLLKGKPLDKVELQPTCTHNSYDELKPGDDKWIFAFPYPIDVTHINSFVFGDSTTELIWNILVSTNRQKDSGTLIFKANQHTSEQGITHELKEKIHIPANSHARLRVFSNQNNNEEFNLTMCYLTTAP